MSPKVSIIITAYQKAGYLPRTIQSVLDQTFRDFELLIVDDGSTDDTRQVVEKFTQVDSRVRYIYQTNQGPSGARNTGMTNAQADLIAHLDGDDAWLPDKLAVQVQVMDACPQIDLLFTNSTLIDTSGEQVREQPDFQDGYVRRMFSLQPAPCAEDVFLLSDADTAARMLRKCVIIPSTLIMRRGVFEKTGAFELSLRGPEDADYWVRAALAGSQFAYSSRATVTYYKNEGSLVLMNKESTYQQQLKFALRAYQSPDYAPVHEVARWLVHARYKDLIAYYGRQNRRGQALRAYRDSLQYGFDARVTGVTLGALLGSGALAAYRRLRRSGAPPAQAGQQ